MSPLESPLAALPAKERRHLVASVLVGLLCQGRGSIRSTDCQHSSNDYEHLVREAFSITHELARQDQAFPQTNGHHTASPKVLRELAATPAESVE